MYTLLRVYVMTWNYIIDSIYYIGLSHMYFSLCTNGCTFSQEVYMCACLHLALAYHLVKFYLLMHVWFSIGRNNFG